MSKYDVDNYEENTQVDVVVRLYNEVYDYLDWWVGRGDHQITGEEIYKALAGRGVDMRSALEVFRQRHGDICQGDIDECRMVSLLYSGWWCVDYPYAEYMADNDIEPKLVALQ